MLYYVKSLTEIKKNAAICFVWLSECFASSANLAMVSSVLRFRLYPNLLELSRLFDSNNLNNCMHIIFSKILETV